MATADRADLWEVSARSETGYVRETNEDRMGAFPVGKGTLYIVADGMGGHNAGARAAELTVQAVHACLAEALPKMSVTEAILASIQKANTRVYEAAHAGDPSTHGMGSTVVLLLTLEQSAYIAHVGDSRAYLYRDGLLSQLTRDHSQVQRLRDTGMLTSAEARNHPFANLVERAIGNEPRVDATLHSPLSLKSGDGILLCSDGLCGYVDDPQIEAVLRADCLVQEVADQLVGLALNAGGHDNVTVQFIQYGTRREARRGSKAEMLLKDPTGRPQSLRYGALALVALTAICLVAGAFALLPRLYEANLGEWASWRKSARTERLANVESLGKDLQVLDSQVKSMRAQAEFNAAEIKRLTAQVAELKRDVDKLKKKPARKR